MKLQYELTAASDFVLAIFAFDFAAIPAGEVFRQAMHSTDFREGYWVIFPSLLAFSLILWLRVFLPQEEKLAALVSSPITLPHQISRQFIGIWIGAVLLLSAHIFIFLY